MRAPPGLHLRQVEVEGIGPWLWIAEDQWAWELPVAEFPAIRDAVLAHTPERKVIVQAGGCMGLYPRLWAESFQTVYTFEPDWRNFYCLTANCPSERIVKFQAALSDYARTTTLHLGHNLNAGMHWVREEKGIIPVLTLDAFAFDRIDAIQLDCEGHEERILKGAVETLMRHRPVLCIEAPNKNVRNMLEGMSYEVKAEAGSMPDVVFSPVGP